MRILTLHSDYISFKPLKKALKNIAELSDADKIEKKIEDVLVVLTAVEKGDDVKDTLKKYVENVKDIAKQVNATNIVLYPYAHLSSDLALPDVAQEILKAAEKELNKEKGMKVERAPFGYYKSFEVKVKGHPLSELSRSFGGTGKDINGAHPSQNLRPRHEVADISQLNSPHRTAHFVEDVVEDVEEVEEDIFSQLKELVELAEIPEEEISKQDVLRDFISERLSLGEDLNIIREKLIFQLGI